MKHATHEEVIDGTPEECFAALLEYESFPEWQRAVRSAEVITRDSEGRGEEVAFEIDAKVRTINYRLRYSYDPPGRITWDYVEGDVKDVDGEFTLEPHGRGATLATYSLALDPGVWMPGPLRKVLSDQVMKGAVEDLKRRVESRDSADTDRNLT